MILYHLATHVTPAALRAAGYDWLAGPGLVRCQTSGGPGGSPGTVLGLASQISADQCRYQPDQQEWIRGTCDGVWVGRWRDAPPPGPADLARPDQIQGHAVELVDGQTWLVPVARGWLEQDGELRWYVALPQRLERRDGTWQAGGVLPRYARLWQIAERWEAQWAAAYAAAVARESGDETDQAETGETLLRLELPLSDAADLAAEVLGANYRVTAAEISLLGLFADATPAAVLDALIDRPTRLAWCKKKLQSAPDTPSTSDGDAGWIEGTDLP